MCVRCGSLYQRSIWTDSSVITINQLSIKRARSPCPRSWRPRALSPNLHHFPDERTVSRAAPFQEDGTCSWAI